VSPSTIFAAPSNIRCLSRLSLRRSRSEGKIGGFWPPYRRYYYLHLDESLLTQGGPAHQSTLAVHKDHTGVRPLSSALTVHSDTLPLRGKGDGVQAVAQGLGHWIKLQQDTPQGTTSCGCSQLVTQQAPFFFSFRPLLLTLFA